MLRPFLVRVAGFLPLLMSCVPATAQLSITRPKPASIQQVSAESPGLAAARSSLLPQIRVTIRYLMVDEPTRAKIYASLDADSIVTQTQLPDMPDRTSDGDRSDDPLQLTERILASSERHFHAPSRVTSGVIAKAESKSIIEIAAASANSEVSNAPAVILVDGREAEMNDVVQHPMVVDMKSEGDVVQPAVSVFEDGLRLRMLASVGAQQDASDGFLLSCEVNTSEILDVKSHKIYGVQAEPVTVQVPIHLMTSATASVRVGGDQTLLIDPHFSRSATISRTRGVPVLDRLPFVGRSFQRVADDETVTRWMIVLLEPSLEKSDKVGP